MSKGKKRSNPESTEFDTVGKVQTSMESKPTPLPVKPSESVQPVVRKKAGDGKDPQLMMTFQRWFSLQGRPPHHKKGMWAFANTKGKRSIAAWNRLFERY